MKFLSELYDVTLKRGIRGKASEGFVRPTIGESFMSHRDFQEVPAVIDPYFSDVNRGIILNNGTRVESSSYPGSWAQMPIEHPLATLNCNSYFTVWGDGGVNQSMSVLEYNYSNTLINTFTVGIHNGVPMHRFVININENKLTTIYGTGSTIINSDFNPSDINNKFIIKWNASINREQMINFDFNNMTSYINNVPEHCRNHIKLKA